MVVLLNGEVKILNTTALSGTTISETGELSFSENKWNSNYGVSVLFVTATVGSGEEAISKTIPVFIRQIKIKTEFSSNILHLQ